MQRGPSTPFQLLLFMRAWKVHEYLNTCVLHTGSFPHGCASLLLHKVIPCNSIALVSTCWICRWRTSGSIYRQQNEVPESANSVLLWFFFFYVNLQLPWWVQSASKIYALAGNLEQNEQLHQLQKEGKNEKVLHFAPRGLVLRINCFRAVINGLMIQKTSRKSNSIVRPPTYAGETYIKYCLSQDLSNLGILFTLLLLFPSQACFCHKL